MEESLHRNCRTYRNSTARLLDFVPFNMYLDFYNSEISFLHSATSLKPYEIHFYIRMYFIWLDLPPYFFLSLSSFPSTLLDSTFCFSVFCCILYSLFFFIFFSDNRAVFAIFMPASQKVNVKRFNEFFIAIVLYNLFIVILLSYRARLSQTKLFVRLIV